MRVADPSKFQSDVTSACLCGFLWNLSERRVCLIAPASPTPDTPLGFRVYAEIEFSTLTEVENWLDRVENAFFTDGPGKYPRLDPQWQVSFSGGEAHFRSHLVTRSLLVAPDMRRMVEKLANGAWSVETGAVPECLLSGHGLLETLWRYGMIVEPEKLAC